VIVGETRQDVAYGYNGFPMGVDDDKSRYSDREVKYSLVVHAELNAIFNSNFNLCGADLFIYPLPPCPECAKAICQKRIGTVYFAIGDAWRPMHSRYSSTPHDSTSLMFKEAGVNLKTITMPPTALGKSLKHDTIN
jgi:dCMP deaminase